MGERKGHASCEILARGISGFLRKAGREVPLSLENTNRSTLRNVASYSSLRSDTLCTCCLVSSLQEMIFVCGIVLREMCVRARQKHLICFYWFLAWEALLQRTWRACSQTCTCTNQSFALILDGRGKACTQGWFSQATKRRVIRALMTWWKSKVGGIKIPIPSCAYESIDYDVEKLKSEVEAEG